MVGNLGMIILIVVSAHLHTPMYYFLSCLSFIDLCHSTVITPKMLVNFVSERNIISYPECMTQLYFFIIFIIAECHMLAVMAYDRYVALCSPLLYNVIMSYQLCSWLVVAVATMAVVGSTVHTGCMLRLHFCKDYIVNNFFCDVLPLLKLSCSSTYINEIVLLAFCSFNVFVPTLIICSSYIFILFSILQIQTTAGRSKAFSTCSSHFMAVSLFFGSTVFMYLQPSTNTMDQRKVSSVFYTIVIPMLNPLIYSLRNKDVKVAVKKILDKKAFS
ncbi:olfactory receptor 150-like [Trichosurus vulpecula]|uniref:olfactory receptor 150-like n=1 Tax=Trichosurus vulpecula TaxID=9337 RepID=UPI00186AE14F|nr:olfactory receptor 150-like [Trichosurus vulpecula]